MKQQLSATLSPVCTARPQPAVRLWQTRNGAPAAQGRQQRAQRAVVVRAGFFSNVADRAEQPDRILDQAVQDMQVDLIKLRQAAAKIAAAKRPIEAECRTARAAVAQWTSRAELAVKAGQDGLAREALTRRNAVAATAQAWEKQLAQHETAAEQLRANAAFLERKLGEAASKKETLKARAAAAASSKQIQELIGGLDTTSGAAALARMEAKVLALEAEAEGAAITRGADSMEDRFRNLELSEDLARTTASANAWLQRGSSWDRSVGKSSFSISVETRRLDGF